MNSIPIHPDLPMPTNCFGKPVPPAQWYKCPHCGKESPLSQAPAQPASIGWQPIATAPMDKTRIALLRLNEDGSVTYGHGFYMPLVGWECWEHYAYKPPTHWVPLPAAPTTGETK